AVEKCSGRACIVIQCGAMQSISLFILCKGFLVFARVLECLAKRKMQGHAVSSPKVRILQALPHRFDIRLVEPESLQVGETEIGFSEIRPKRDGLSVCSHRRIEPAADA